MKKLTEAQLRTVVKRMISEALTARDFGPGESLGTEVEAPGAVSMSVSSGPKKTNIEMFLDAWRAAGGVWTFSVAKRFYLSLGTVSATGTSGASMTVSKLLSRYGYKDAKRPEPRGWGDDPSVTTAFRSEPWKLKPQYM